MDKKARRRNRKQRAQQRAQRADTGFELLVPMWEYPRAAAQVAARTQDSGDPIAYEDALAISAAHPVRLAEPGGRPSVIVPIELAEHVGMELGTFLAWVAELHAEGVLEWDAQRRVHRVDTSAAELRGLLSA